MPTYQYRCTNCQQELEVVQKFSDSALTVCPSCEGQLRKIYNAVGVVFKGSGFYKTDSRGPGTGAEKNGSGGNDAGSSSGSKDSGSSGKETGGSKDSGSSTPAASTSSSGSKQSGGGGSAPAGKGSSSS